MHLFTFITLGALVFFGHSHTSPVEMSSSSIESTSTSTNRQALTFGQPLSPVPSDLVNNVNMMVTRVEMLQSVVSELQHIYGKNKTRESPSSSARMSPIDPLEDKKDLSANIVTLMNGRIVQEDNSKVIFGVDINAKIDLLNQADLLLDITPVLPQIVKVALTTGKSKKILIKINGLQ